MSQTVTHLFILSLTYIRPLAEVDALMDAHVSYLETEYMRGSFLLSGRKEPRTGGIILARADSQETIQRIIANDPFLQRGIATYEVIEFQPTKSISVLTAVIA
jgi:uncharacterized protein YciI